MGKRKSGDNVARYNIFGSHGEFKLNAAGEVIPNPNISEAYNDILACNIQEYFDCYPEDTEVFKTETDQVIHIDICDIGYWYRDKSGKKKYEEFSDTHRLHVAFNHLSDWFLVRNPVWDVLREYTANDEKVCLSLVMIFQGEIPEKLLTNLRKIGFKWQGDELQSSFLLADDKAIPVTTLRYSTTEINWAMLQFASCMIFQDFAGFSIEGYLNVKEENNKFNYVNTWSGGSFTATRDSFEKTWFDKARQNFVAQTTETWRATTSNSSLTSEHIPEDIREAINAANKPKGQQ